ncbi:MAG TPA: rhodanese-like domain-containing protein [Sideroxyarcus sp.]|nr:rhodanese-like domain-containing protein [Sideroxyarcus sp.]
MAGIQRCIVALAVLVLAGCGPKAEQLVDARAAFDRQARGELLLDVRESDDYKEFHIPNSMNLPFGRLASRLAELEPYRNKPIIVIDHSGLRAPRALEQLQEAGYSQVFIVNGGVVAWQAAGLTVEKLDMQPQPQ